MAIFGGGGAARDRSVAGLALDQVKQLHDYLHQMAVGYVTWTLGRYHGDYQASAKALGISSKTIYRYLPASSPYTSLSIYEMSADVIPTRRSGTSRLLRFFGQSSHVNGDRDLVLGDARKRYHELAKRFHPDFGGSSHAMTKLNRAWNTLEKRLKQ